MAQNIEVDEFDQLMSQPCEAQPSSSCSVPTSSFSSSSFSSAGPMKRQAEFSLPVFVPTKKNSIDPPVASLGPGTKFFVYVQVWD